MLYSCVFIVKHTAINTAKKKSVFCPVLQELLRKRSPLKTVFDELKGLSTSNTCGLEFDDLGPNPQLVQVVSPLKHHLAPLIHELGPVISHAQRS